MKHWFREAWKAWKAAPTLERVLFILVVANFMASVIRLLQ